MIAGFLVAMAAAAPVPADAYDIATRVATWGPRPAASAREARAHRLVRRIFRDADLRVGVQEFRVPGRGRSRNVIGVYDTPRSCLRIVMAHADTTAAGPGANDNASGVGVVASLAGRLRLIKPWCDVWLVATGAEERVYTGSPDHLGALARRAEATPMGAVGRRGRTRLPVLAALAGRHAAPEGGGRAARRRAVGRHRGHVGARRRHGELGPPGVPAARAPRRQARRGRGRGTLPPHGVRRTRATRARNARARAPHGRRGAARPLGRPAGSVTLRPAPARRRRDRARPAPRSGPAATATTRSGR